MHRNLCDVSPRGSETRGRWGFAVMATVLLSFGVGSVTAAFVLMNGVAPHATTSLSCDTIMQLSSDPSMHARYASANVSSPVVLQLQTLDAYNASYEAAGDASADTIEAWSDLASGLDPRLLAPLFAAAALALLIVSARTAARLLDAPRNAAIVASSAIGALVVSATLITIFGLPALGIRAIVFAIGVSALAVRFARTFHEERIFAA